MHPLFEQLASIVRPPSPEELTEMTCPVLSPAKKLLNEIHWLIHDACYEISEGRIEEAKGMLLKADILSHDDNDIIK